MYMGMFPYIFFYESLYVKPWTYLTVRQMSVLLYFSVHSKSCFFEKGTDRADTLAGALVPRGFQLSDPPTDRSDSGRTLRVETDRDGHFGGN